MSREQRKIGVVSLRDDLHVHAVTFLARQRGYRVVHLCVDDLANCISSFRICADGELYGRLQDAADNQHEIGDFGVIWWRRSSSAQTCLDETHDAQTHGIVNRSAAAHVFGLFCAGYRGKFVNNPIKAFAAENKLFQMKAALEAGLPVPETLFSNDPGEVSRFFYMQSGDVVVKNYGSIASVQTKTTKMTERMLSDVASIRMAPAIYQRFIEGSLHYRIVVAGGNYVACETENRAIDSRLDLTAPVRAVQIDDDLLLRLKECLASLGLEMGIFDFKKSSSGQMYFLEVNQQGQFAYLDAIASTKALEMVTGYLIACCNENFRSHTNSRCQREQNDKQSCLDATDRVPRNESE